MIRDGRGIEVAGLYKDYRVHRRTTGMLNTVRSIFRRTYENVTAVRDLSFTIEPGERVGKRRRSRSCPVSCTRRLGA